MGISAAAPQKRSRMDVLVAKRIEARREAIASLAPLALDELRQLGLEAKLIGSAASGRIHEYSDIDILVKGDVTARHRQAAEQTLARVLKTSKISFDLFFACDLTARQTQEFERGWA